MALRDVMGPDKLNNNDNNAMGVDVEKS